MKQPWRPDSWSYSVSEVSAGVYAAVADDGQGGQLREAGPDPDDALLRVKTAALHLTSRRRAAAADLT